MIEQTFCKNLHYIYITESPTAAGGSDHSVITSAGSSLNALLTRTAGSARFRDPYPHAGLYSVGDGGRCWILEQLCQ